MVGIVLVSHSAQLAEGTAELAREMGGEEAKLEPAGGLAEPGALGTDAVRVLEAIERAWGDDGVLVLMDLGSAVLSAETALDFLPDERRGRVLLCEAPLVEGAVSAAVAAKVGASLQEVAAEARRGLEPKAAHLGADEAVSTAAPVVHAEPDGEWEEARILVANRLGLHARPAARFVQTASGFDAVVEVSNATTGTGPVSARSLNAVATLGVRQGHEVAVRARGPQASAALEALRTLADDGFGEGVKGAPVAAAPPQVPVTAPGAGTTLTGLAAAPGLAVGPSRRLRRAEPELPDGRADDAEAEWRELHRALREAGEAIRRTRDRVAELTGQDEAAIFDAHLLFLEDDALLEPARRAIFDRHEHAARAWLESVQATAQRWRALDDEYLRERADDVDEVGRRVLAHLLGVPVSPALIEPGILVATDLAPGETAELDPDVVRGIATAGGGPTSHGAILARALGVPAVVAAGDALLAVREGTTLVVDGDSGRVQVDPPSDLLERLEHRLRRREETEREAWASAHEPAVTRDGHRIEVGANVGTQEDVELAVRAGAEGVGLLRTEFLFLGRAALPGVDEQAEAYRGLAAALDGRPLILRTLDVGADKPLPSLPQPADPNPFLGVRGIRLALARPELLVDQLRAALRVAAEFPLKVMFPMVASLAELLRVKELLGEARLREGAGAPDRVELGVMIEVPSAALTADRLAEEVDFFSIGTNDLGQYTTAADRDNPRVAGLADPLHPAVLELIVRVVDAAASRGRWVGVCGEAAGDPVAVPLLVGLGVDELSAAPRAVPRVKQVVRALEVPAARELAGAARRLGDAAAVRELVAREAAEAVPGI